MTIAHFQITNDTTPAHLDVFFTRLWKKKDRVKLVIDATQCSNVSFGRIASVKDVLDTHRQKSREHLEFSVIFVRSRFVRNIIRLGLRFVRTERPVYIETMRSDDIVGRRVEHRP